MGKKLTTKEIQDKIIKNCKENIELIGEYKNRRTPVLVKCNDCGYEWEAKPHTLLYEPKEGEGPHRCPKCSAIEYFENRSSGQWVEYEYCGKKIWRMTSRIKSNKTGYFYCCKEHGNLHKNELREESEWKNTSQYRIKALKTYPHKCNVCGWNEDERILEVHHIDENRSNNDIDNLVILCPICHRKITLHYYIYDKENHILIKKD